MFFAAIFKFPVYDGTVGWRAPLPVLVVAVRAPLYIAKDDGMHRVMGLGSCVRRRQRAVREPEPSVLLCAWRGVSRTCCCTVHVSLLYST